MCTHTREIWRIILIFPYVLRRFGCDSRPSSSCGQDYYATGSPTPSSCASPAFGNSTTAATPTNGLRRTLTPSREEKTAPQNNNGKPTPAVSLDRIDRLFGAPDKIHIPERLLPEAEGRTTAEEAARKQEKVESIRRLLGEGAAESGGGQEAVRLLTLNQLIAHQVKARSRSLAAAAAASSGGVFKEKDAKEEDERSDLSPDIPLPLRQQRESFLI